MSYMDSKETRPWIISKDGEFMFIVWPYLKKIQKIKTGCAHSNYIADDFYTYDQLNEIKEFLNDHNWNLLQKEIFEGI